MTLRKLGPAILCIVAHASELSVVEQAQSLFLDSHRVKAVELLVTALKHENNPKQRLKIRSTLNAVSQDFLTEQGQKLFELGLSLERTNPSSASQRFLDALNLEDNNLQILLALARTKVASKKCSEAKNFIDQGLLLNPYFDELQELKIRMQICLGDRDVAKLDVRMLDHSDLSQWRIRWLKGQLLLSDHSSPSVRPLLEQVSHEAPKFPEVYYSLWKLEKTTSELKSDLAKKYVALCKGSAIKVIQDFRFEPELCSHVDDVQADIDLQLKHMDDDIER